MDGIPNPVSGNSFVDLVSFRNKAVFADKTDFIAKISANINRNRRLFAVPRIWQNRNGAYAPRLLLKGLCRAAYF